MHATRGSQVRETRVIGEEKLRGGRGESTNGVALGAAALATVGAVARILGRSVRGSGVPVGRVYSMHGQRVRGSGVPVGRVYSMHGKRVRARRCARCLSVECECTQRDQELAESVARAA